MDENETVEVTELTSAELRRAKFFVTAVKQGKRLVPRNIIEARIKRQHNIEADELRTLFPDDKDLFEFFAVTLDTVKALENVNELDSDYNPPEEEDNYVLSKEEQQEVKDIELETKRRDKQKIAKQLALQKEANAMFPDKKLDVIAKQGTALIKRKQNN
jgi:hypothetical protein